MDARKRKRLVSAGWRVGTTADFLGLTKDEVALIDMRHDLSFFVRTARRRSRMSQAALADRLGSSQSRVAKLEAGDPSVSLDLIVRAAIAAGGTRAEVAKALAARRRVAAG